MTRILLVSTQKADSTGSGVYLTQLARAFIAAGHEVALVAGTAPGDAPELPAGITFAPVCYETPALPFPVCGMSDMMPYPSTRYRDLTPEMVQQLLTAFDAALDELLTRFTPELCLSNHLYLLTAHLAHRGLGFPVYALCHGSDLRQYEKNPLMRAEIHEGLQSLAGCFALHEEQAKKIEALHGMKALIGGTGYDDGLFRCMRSFDSGGFGGFAQDDDGGSAANAASAAPVILSERSESKDLATPIGACTPRLIFVGKIARAKGVPSLLRALELLPQRCELTLVGGAGSAEELAEAQTLAAASRHNIRFTGKLAPAELVRPYNEASVFVLPSFYEGLPLVAIEALACGCKVVITELPGLREWFDVNAPGAPVFYVQPPRMQSVDVPLEEELPAFEQRLAACVEQALVSDAAPADVTHLSWHALAERMLERVALPS